jgi:hypothetical protein
MHGDGGIDQIASQRSEAGKCPLPGHTGFTRFVFGTAKFSFFV